MNYRAGRLGKVHSSPLHSRRHPAAMVGLGPFTVALACTTGLATVSAVLETARVELDSALEPVERAVALGLHSWT